MKQFLFTTLLFVTCLLNAQTTKSKKNNETTTDLPKVAGTSRSTPLPGPIDPTDPNTDPIPIPIPIPAANNEVGVIAGQLSISLSGAANYTIPIAVPPGINGVAPQISLGYSSQGGVGMAGYGWNVSGLSSISRIPATKFHDGVIDGVDQNSLDRFALDGQRLILKTGTYGYYQATYETENFSNLKITSFNLLPNTLVRSFKVEYPDGSFAIYGDDVNNASVTEWVIKYWQNPQGLTINYNYTKTNNKIFIDTITYGSVGTATPINIVQFVYKNRIRPEEAYVAGFRIVNDKILSQIKIIGNGIGYKNYVLAHDDIMGYERLISITEKTGDNTKSLKPTVFSYAENISNNSNITNTITPNFITIASRFDLEKSVGGDFDGDGDSDYIFGSNLFTKVYDDGTIPVTTPLINVNDSSKIYSIKCLEGASSNFKLMNRNAWCIKDTGNNTTAVPITFTIYSKDPASNQVITEYSKQIPNTGYGYNIGYDRFFSGDFNGDGLTDIMDFQEDSSGTPSLAGHVTLKLIDLDRRIISNFVTTLGSIIIPQHYEIRIADVNGDGKSDIIVFEGFTNHKITVYTLNENNNVVQLSQTPITFLHPGTYNLFQEVIPASTTGHWEVQYIYGNLVTIPPPIIGVINIWVPDVLSIQYIYPIVLGDFNGDGKSDILLPGIERLLLLSTGNGFVSESIPSNFPAPHDLGSVLAADFDNDGKTDVVSIITSSTTHSINNLNRISSSNWTTSLSTYYNTAPQAGNTKFKMIPLMVKNSKIYSNKPQIVLFRFYDTYQNKNIGFYTNQNALMTANKSISTITSGNGVAQNITYAPLINQSNGIYQAATQFKSYPDFDIQNIPSLNVVSQIEQISNLSTKKQQFQYFGAVSNTEGLGFLGFNSVLKTNWFNDATTPISTITKFDSNKRGAPIESFSVLGIATPTLALTSNDPFVNKSTTTYNNEGTTLYENPLLPNKVFKLKNTKTVTYNGLENTSSETITEFNNNNKPITITNIIKNASTIEKTTVETLTYNPPTAAPYLVDMPLGKVTTASVTGDTSNTEEAYIYNANLLMQIKKKGNNTNFITEDNQYDGYGNITQKTLSAPGLTSRVETYEYDPTTHRFVTKKINKEGLVTKLGYNLSTGWLLSETLPSGTGTFFTILYQYDTWGKKTKTTDFLGKSETYTYANSLDSDGIVKIIMADNGSSSSIQVDELGRTVLESSLDISGAYSYTNSQYNSNNQLILKSQPNGGLYSVWNEASYDIYGRLTQSTSLKSANSSGKIINYSYSGLTTTENDGIKTKTTLKNALGNVVSLTETPGGTITYSYFANGNLKNTTSSGATTSITQDGWGRKIGLSDPSAGNFLYEYNDFGEMTKETVVGKGETIFNISSTGKLNFKTISDVGGVIKSKNTYTYDPVTKSLIKLRFDDFVASSFTDTNYLYDNYNRLISNEEDNVKTKFVTTTGYDNFGRPSNTTYLALNKIDGKQSYKSVTNTFKNGFNYQILDDATGTPLWQTNTVNAYGELTSGRYGNGIRVTNTYDEFGFPTQIKHDKTATLSVMKLNTVFDPITGNLTNRNNTLFGTWNENFSYDSSDRLTTYQNTTGVQNQSYNANGTILNNNVGGYAYTVAGKPFVLNTITPVDQSSSSPELNYYSSRTQNITYNLFKSPETITELTKENIDFEYNAFNSRSAMFYGGLQPLKNNRPLIKYYSADGSMEIKINNSTGTAEFITYIGGDAYTAPAIFKSDGLGTENFYYLHRDYQGTINLITNSTGGVVEKRLFDVWGALLKYNNNGTTVSMTLPTTSLAGLFMDRGYTGHEHLFGVGLINMNGRIYDPKLHRFLQPDNNLQDPFNTQNYNRYSYGMNNPTKYSDPSGENWFDIIGFIFSFYVHGAQASGEANPTKWDSTTWANAGLSIASTFVSAGATYYANNYIETYNSHPNISTPVTNNIDNHSYITYAGDFLIGAGQTADGFVNPISLVTGLVKGQMQVFSNDAEVLGGNFSLHAILSSHFSGGLGDAFRMGEGIYTLTDKAFSGDGKAGGALFVSLAAILLTDGAGSVATTEAVVVEESVVAAEVAAKGETSLIQANRTAGNLFRDELASALRAEGRTVNTEVFKRTPFGPRYMDLDIWSDGVNLGGIEAKVGGSRYLPLQKLKDAWLGANGYPVQLVRKPINW